MYLEFNSSSYMGLPDSPLFLSDKGLHANMDKECNFFSRPMLEFQDVSQIAPVKEAEIREEDQRVSENFQQERKDQAQAQVEDENHEEKEDRRTHEEGLVVSSLKVKLPSPREVLMLDDEEDASDGLTTPTSLDHKIPLVCPPAPRKPKPIPGSTANRKMSRRRVLLDMSNEIESLFPPSVVADFGNKIKKVRKESVIIS